jgi:hypothetical protein
MRKNSALWKNRLQANHPNKILSMDDQRKNSFNQTLSVPSTADNKPLYRHSMKLLTPENVGFDLKPVTAAGQRV